MNLAEWKVCEGVRELKGCKEVTCICYLVKCCEVTEVNDKLYVYIYFLELIMKS